MKRIVSLILAVITLAALLLATGCAEQVTGKVQGASELIALPKNATLHVGYSKTFKNTVDETSSAVYLDYVKNITYSLKRTYYYYDDVPENYFKVNGRDNYYYYWEKSVTTEQALLGNRTARTETVYSYLPYGDGESIMVKTTTVTTYSFDYEGGFIDKNIEYYTDLNGYFYSFDALKTEYPDLAAAAYTGNLSDKYYVDTKVRSVTETKKDEFSNTYYYITYQDESAESTVE